MATEWEIELLFYHHHAGQERMYISATLWWSECETDKVQRWYGAQRQLLFALLFNSLWMAKHRPRRPSASCERRIVLYSTSTANKCFIALFTQWNLFHYFYKKANCPSQITALMKHNQSQYSHRGATERNSVRRRKKKNCPVRWFLMKNYLKL